MTEINEQVVVGNDERLISKAKGKLKIIVWMNKVEKMTVTLEEVLYVPGIEIVHTP